MQARAGLHVGEVLTWKNSATAVQAGAKPLEVEGLAKPLAGRLTAILTGKEAGFRPGTLVRIEFEAGLVPRRGRVVRTIPPAPG